MLALLQQNLGFAWGAVATVTVPDVVGETEAQATTDIEALGLVVAVVTANSSSVAAGLVISQDPAASTEVAPGSTVTITVSLGDAASGGGFWFDFEYEMARRRKRQREEDEEREAEERLQDEIDRNIAILLHEQERKDQERKALERLRGLVSKYATEKTNNERLDRALNLAQQKQTLASYEALEREFNRAQEDEELMFLLAMLAEI